MAVEYPDRIGGVVCLEPAYGVSAEEANECGDLIDQMMKPGWPQTLAQEFPAWERGSTPLYFRELHWRRMLAMDPIVVKETFVQLFTGADPLPYREKSGAYLAQRVCPVLSVYALERSEHPEWERRHSRNPASRFLHLPLGHWVQQDAPDLINQLIEQWLGTISYGAQISR